MYYEINVSLNGRHLFATAERSITNFDKLKKIYVLFKEKFPEEDGYRLTVTREETIGKFLNMEEEMKKA